MSEFLKLILVTQKNNSPLNSYLDFIVQCAEAGITAVQLREKNYTYPELFKFAKQLQEVLHPFAIPLIINDHVALAAKVDAFGVHLGQGDGDIITARQKLGPHKKIGYSINSLAQLQLAHQLPIDYVGIGAIFATANKKDVETIWGLEYLKQITAICKYPVVAIGGIDQNNAEAVIRTGVHGIAAIGAFHNAEHPALTTKQLRQLIDENNL